MKKNIAISLLLLPLCAAPALSAGGQAVRAFPDFAVSSGPVPLAQQLSTGAVVGRGGNYALALPGGGTLWLLNDIWIGETGPAGDAVWGIVEGAAALAESTAPFSQRAVKYSLDENGWPLPLFGPDGGAYSQVRKYRPRAAAAAGGKYYVFYSILNNYGPDLYDYFRVGQGLAEADRPEGPYSRSTAAPAGFWNDLEPAFGSAVLDGGDGWLYVYGRAMNAPGEYGAALARVKPEGLADPAAYAYYSEGPDGGSWTADVSEASEVFEDAPEEFSVTDNAFLGGFLLVYSDPDTGSALARTAAYPWGPWSEPVTLVACAAGDYCSGAKEQGAFAAAGGRRIYLTIEKKNAPYLYEITFK